MFSDSLQRYSSHRAACKQWSAGLGVLILLIGALAGLNPTKMLWAAGPLLLLGLVEAGYAAQERRYAELLKAKKISEETPALLPEPASASVVRVTFAALSLSIWPFYLGLFAIVGIGGEEMAASNKKVLVSNGPPTNYAPAGMMRPVAANGVSLGPSTSLRAECGSGGCGTTAGCGSGSCGASAGKGCSCGSGAATAQQMKRTVQPYGQTAPGPMAYQGAAYQPMPQGQTMPQQAQFQRLPNGAIVNARPPNLAPGQPAAAASMPSTNPNANPAPGQPEAAAPVAPAVAPASVAPEPVAATAAPALRSVGGQR